MNRAISTTSSRALFGVDQRGEFVDKISEYLEERVSGPGRDLERIREDANAVLKNLNGTMRRERRCEGLV